MNHAAQDEDHLGNTARRLLSDKAERTRGSKDGLLRNNYSAWFSLCSKFFVELVAVFQASLQYNTAGLVLGLSTFEKGMIL